MTDVLDEETSEDTQTDTTLPTQDDMYLVAQDTPINKATLAELGHEQQIKFIETLQDRRTRISVAVVKARAAKTKSIEQENLAKALKFDKIIEKLEKELAKADKSLGKCEELADELKVMRLTMGDRDE